MSDELTRYRAALIEIGCPVKLKTSSRCKAGLPPTTGTLLAELNRRIGIALTALGDVPKMDDRGYAFHNPDTQWEWSANDPIESGECPDAGIITRMTYREFRALHPAVPEC